MNKRKQMSRYAICRTPPQKRWESLYEQFYLEKGYKLSELLLRQTFTVSLTYP